MKTNASHPQPRFIRRAAEIGDPAASNAARPRTCHLIDIENQVGGPDATVEDIQRWWRIYCDEAVGVSPGDQVVVGASHFAAKTVWFALPDQGIQRRVKSGPDGAESAILDALDIEHISTFCDRLVVASSDHAFAPLARSARALGMTVQMVIGLGTPSRALMAACATRSRIRSTPRVAAAGHALAA